jgi:hypothetical protein
MKFETWNLEIRSWNCVVLEAESSKEGVGFIEGEAVGQPA